MKIAVCGSGTVLDRKTAEIAAEIGKEIAENKHILLTGGCCGYPNEAAKAAFENKGSVIAYSPAKDKKGHAEKYSFPTENFTEIIYTGKGIPGRNLDLVKAADAVIIIGGKAGTLNEFTIAFQLGRRIGVLLGSGGISCKIREIAGIIGKNKDKNNIKYSSGPKELVNEMAELRT
ncbi:hypothetical protein GF323_05680 [Candidatus Woesearchaeota archaeon]|nr:hypothetical protein [Candidatus Woesearchaeota archaeon]